MTVEMHGPESTNAALGTAQELLRGNAAAMNMPS